MSISNYKYYDEIKTELNDLNPAKRYEKLLHTQEWQTFRQHILRRDFNRCRMCNSAGGNLQEKIPQEEYERLKQLEIKKGSKEGYLEFIGDDIEINYRQYFPPDIRITYTSLEVHHKLYFFNCLPWQYDFKYLITLCHHCHKKVHENQKFFIYSDQTLKSGQELKTCTRCQGSGFLPQYEDYKNGICFNCCGAGIAIDKLFS